MSSADIARVGAGLAAFDPEDLDDIKPENVIPFMFSSIELLPRYQLQCISGYINIFLKYRLDYL